MRIKVYQEFINEEIGLRKAILGGALGASALMTPAAHTEPANPPKDTTATTNVYRENVNKVKDFVDTLQRERPELFLDKQVSDNSRLKFGEYERLMFLKNRSEQSGIDLKLDLLTQQPSLFPFNINYFLVRGLDDIEGGPVLIKILRLDYTAALSIANHEVMFNFTRVQDVNTFGAKVNF